MRRAQSGSDILTSRGESEMVGCMKFDLEKLPMRAAPDGGGGGGSWTPNQKVKPRGGASAISNLLEISAFLACGAALVLSSLKLLPADRVTEETIKIVMLVLVWLKLV